MSDEKVIELQTRLAFQEQALSTLSEQVYAQERDIEELKVQLRHVSRALRSLREGGGEDSGQPFEIPPHY